MTKAKTQPSRSLKSQAFSTEASRQMTSQIALRQMRDMEVNVTKNITSKACIQMKSQRGSTSHE